MVSLRQCWCALRTRCMGRIEAAGFLKPGLVPAMDRHIRCSRALMRPKPGFVARSSVRPLLLRRHQAADANLSALHVTAVPARIPTAWTASAHTGSSRTRLTWVYSNWTGSQPHPEFPHASFDAVQRRPSRRGHKHQDPRAERENDRYGHPKRLLASVDW